MLPHVNPPIILASGIHSSFRNGPRIPFHFNYFVILPHAVILIQNLKLEVAKLSMTLKLNFALHSVVETGT